MGSLQLCTPVGGVTLIMYKSLITSCLAVATLASPDASPAPHHVLAVHTNALVGSGGISPAWPATRALGLDSTCYGCRPVVHVHGIGKRSAEAEADPYYGYGYGHAVGLGLNNIHGLSHFGYGHGIGQLHPGAASSFQAIHRLRLSLRLMLGTDTDTDRDTDTVWDTTVMAMDTMVMDTGTDTDTATTDRR